MSRVTHSEPGLPMASVKPLNCFDLFVIVCSLCIQIQKDSTLVCSEHFKPDEIEETLAGKKRLKKQVVPSIFAWVKPKQALSNQRIYISEEKGFDLTRRRP